MSWQSYFAIYTGINELEHLKYTINEYQQIWVNQINGLIEKNGEEIREEIGEKIEEICLARIEDLKMFHQQKYMLMFGIGGGRINCVDFFQSRGIILEEFCSEINNYIEPMYKWYHHSESFLPDNFVEKMYNNGYVNYFTTTQRQNILKYIKRNKTYWNEQIKDFPDKELDEIQREIKKVKKEEKIK